MARLYCAIEDVKNYLPANVVVEGENPTPNWRNPNKETVDSVNIEFFIKEASSRIDSALATMYDVPLKKVNDDGEIVYPNPVSTICSILASQMIYGVLLQGGQHQKSEAQELREKWAEKELTNIQNGERKLLGQRATRGSRFITSTLYNAPKNPAEGGRSKNEGS